MVHRDRYPWSTDDEIRFIEGIGKWRNRQRTDEEKVELLQNYLSAIPKRADRGMVNWVKVRARVEALIQKGTKP